MKARKLMLVVGVITGLMAINDMAFSQESKSVVVKTNDGKKGMKVTKDDEGNVIKTKVKKDADGKCEGR